MNELLSKMEAALEVRAKRPATRQAYAGCVRRFLEHYAGHDPRTLGADGVEAFLSHLSTQRRLSGQSRNVYAAALRFLYAVVLRRPEVVSAIPKAHVPRRLPVVLDASEVAPERRKHILPVHHFHVVFTLPAELRPLMQANPRALYGLLFETAPKSVLQLARDPKRLGAQLGLTAVLHTWRRDLGYHPHLHCVVTGGGLDEQGQWRATRPGFLLPVRVLGKLLRGKFLDGLRRLHARGELVLPACLPDAHAFEQLLDKLYQKSWCVYCKRPFGGADAVFEYLGRYTHRIGISNARILHVSERAVVFRTRLPRTAMLPPQLFLSRLLQHVLPHGFVRIRHYGLLASGNVRGALAKAKSLLETSRPLPTAPPVPNAADPALDEPRHVRLYRELTGVDLRVCARCGGAMTPHPLPAVERPAQARERAPP